MGIDVQLRDETGTVLEVVGDEKFILSGAVSRGYFSGTNLLCYLVPWGDAIFNQAQAGVLMIDIRTVIDACENEQVVDHLLSLRPLIDRLSIETHLYLWFVGD